MGKLMRTLLLCSALLGLSLVGALAESTMENEKNVSGAACKIDGSKSACGLPSKAVIDMTKTKVKHSNSEWKKLLTPDQYRVARLQGTEPPFQNAYWNHH